MVWNVAIAFVSPNGMKKELKEALMHPECHLIHVHQVHADLVVVRVKIKLGEVIRAAQVDQQLLDQDKEFVNDRLGIEGMIVDVEMP
jgi:hypothetical protein